MKDPKKVGQFREEVLDHLANVDLQAFEEEVKGKRREQASRTIEEARQIASDRLREGDDSEQVAVEFVGEEAWGLMSEEAKSALLRRLQG